MLKPVLCAALCRAQSALVGVLESSSGRVFCFLLLASPRQNSSDSRAQTAQRLNRACLLFEGALLFVCGWFWRTKGQHAYCGASPIGQPSTELVPACLHFAKAEAVPDEL